MLDPLWPVKLLRIFHKSTSFQPSLPANILSGWSAGDLSLLQSRRGNVSLVLQIENLWEGGQGVRLLHERPPLPTSLTQLFLPPACVLVCPEHA
eukprot:182259-Pelagomonas_calceolata.AAC.3